MNKINTTAAILACVCTIQAQQSFAQQINQSQIEKTSVDTLKTYIDSLKKNHLEKVKINAPNKSALIMVALL